MRARRSRSTTIRTTLQALISLTTNTQLAAHQRLRDEAITRPKEEAGRRAMAVQLVIKQGMGVWEEREPQPRQAS